MDYQRLCSNLISMWNKKYIFNKNLVNIYSAIDWNGDFKTGFPLVTDYDST